MQKIFILLTFVLLTTACGVAGDPAFPEKTTYPKHYPNR